MRKTILLLEVTLLFSLAFAQGFSTTTTKIAGVRQVGETYEGITADLVVEVKEGSGRVFVETMPLTQIDTQASARLAKEVSCEILSRDCDSIDFFYIIHSDFPMVGGPSAGGAMTAATLAALLNKEMNPKVVMTGTINPDGSIGPVGGIFEKALAIIDPSVNASIFLIPRGEAITVTHEGEQVDIIDYAKKNWGLQVIEVDSVTDALKYLSGVEIIEQKYSSADIASSDYSAAMKEMSKALINESISVLSYAYSELDEFSFVKYESVITQIINSSNEILKEAENLFASAQYYSAASYAVRSLIFAHYARNLMKYYSASNGKAEARALLDNVSAEINALDQMINNGLKIDHVYDIESIAISIDRLMEAEKYLEEANKDYYNENFESCLYNLAFTSTRLETVKTWWFISSFFSSSYNLTFSASKIKPLAQSRIEQARSAVTYAETITSGGFLDEAVISLDSADEAYANENYVFALFEALHARASANLEMEVRGFANITTKISDKREYAVRAVVRAEEKGMLPFLALSYIEYAGTFENEDPAQALLFLSYAREFAGLGGDILYYLSEEAIIEKQKPLIIPFYLPSQTSIDIWTQFILIISGFMIGAGITIWRYKRK